MTSSRTGPVRPPRSMMFVDDTLPVSAAHRLSAPGAYGAPTSTASVAISYLASLKKCCLIRTRTPLRSQPAHSCSFTALVLGILPQFLLALLLLCGPVPV